MAKFTFTREESTYYNNAKSTAEFSAVTLDDVLGEFEMFLRGCGFQFEGNIITLKSNETVVTYEDEVNNKLNDIYSDELSERVKDINISW
jgi:hypothetical protein